MRGRHRLARVAAVAADRGEHVRDDREARAPGSRGLAHPGHVLGRTRAPRSARRRRSRPRAGAPSGPSRRAARAPARAGLHSSLKPSTVKTSPRTVTRSPESRPRTNRDTLAQTAEGRLERDAHLRLDPVPVARAEPSTTRPGAMPARAGRLQWRAARGCRVYGFTTAEADREARGDRGGRGRESVSNRGGSSPR